MKKKTIIITPIYKEEITESELLTIKSTQKYLSEYEKVIIAPEKFSSNNRFISMWNLYGYKVSFFPNKHFKDIQSHNSFMLNKDFYKSFDNYQYMLIVQLDVLILSNSLHYWLEKDIDYMGAPWVVKDYSGTHFNYAGNGGLSLRNIQTFIKVLESKKLFHKFEYIQQLSCRIEIKYIFIIKLLIKFNFLNSQAKLFRLLYKGNEDYFWTYFAPFFVKDFKIANMEDSLAFAFECCPEFCFKKNNFSLPFGVHAWETYNPKFWKRHKASLFTELKTEIPKTQNIQGYLIKDNH